MPFLPMNRPTPDPSQEGNCKRAPTIPAPLLGGAGGGFGGSRREVSLGIIFIPHQRGVEDTPLQTLPRPPSYYRIARSVWSAVGFSAALFYPPTRGTRKERGRLVRVFETMNSRTRLSALHVEADLNTFSRFFIPCLVPESACANFGRREPQRIQICREDAGPGSRRR